MAAYVLGGCLVGVCGCSKPNPIWGLVDGSGTGGVTGNAPSTTAGGSSSVGGFDTDVSCDSGFSASFDGSEPFAENGWNLGGGMARGPTCPTGLSIARLDRGDTWTDARFEMTVSIDESCPMRTDPNHGAGLMARIDDSNGCAALSAVFCILDVARERLFLGIADNGCNGNMNENASDGYRFEVGVEYRMVLDVEGNSATCRVGQSGTVVAEATITDPDGVMPQLGSVAFFSEEAAATVRSLTVCPGV